MTATVSRKAQFANSGLRMLPMAAKLLLTLYMGRYFSLAEMGVYGLVFGAVTIFCAILGQGFGFVVARDVVDAPPATALRQMRDQALLLGANYLVLVLAAVVAVAFDVTGVSPEIVALTVALAILEGYATALYNNMNSLNQQLLANATFFIRAGLWVFPVALLGWLDPAYRTAEAVLVAWVVGVVVSLAATLWFWRAMPWGEALRQPVDWDWLRTGVAKCLPIWLGGIGVTVGVFVDRFVVERYLTLEAAGVLTFYFSFANALANLMQSGVLAFAYPRLIAAHRAGDESGFRREAQHSTWQAALGAGVGALALAVAVPLLGRFAARPELVDNAETLWLLLFGVWIRVIAEAFNFVLYARHQDRAIWLGNLLFLLPATGGNALLVPLIGLAGAGWASVLSNAFLALWRWRRAQEDDDESALVYARETRET
jgi:O-antigen/teichoic acid export membrane protein